MKAHAKGISAGLAAVIEVFFPITAIAEVAREFREQFPTAPRLSLSSTSIEFDSRKIATRRVRSCRHPADGRKSEFAPVCAP